MILVIIRLVRVDKRDCNIIIELKVRKITENSKKPLNDMENKEV